MKKVIVMLFAVIMLLTGCAVQEAVPEITLLPSSTREPVATSTATPTPTPYKLTIEQIVKKGSVEEGKFSFHVVFPDPVFAYVVAMQMGKDVNDMTSMEELAAYTGELSAGVTSLDNAEGESVTVHSLEGIGYLTGITSFSNAKNDVEVIPDEIGKLVNLTEMNLLKSYDLKHISPEIGKLSQLKILNVALTQLENLPSEIGELKNLEELVVSVTALTVLPDEIGNISSLKKLDVHGNKIRALPDSICNLTALEELNAREMRLTSLPENMGNMTSLRWIDLFGNNVHKLPDSMRNLKSLTYLNVYDNYNLDEGYKDMFDTSVWQV